jgi:hypothetical protein
VGGPLTLRRLSCLHLGQQFGSSKNAPENTLRCLTKCFTDVVSLVALQMLSEIECEVSDHHSRKQIKNDGSSLLPR